MTKMLFRLFSQTLQLIVTIPDKIEAKKAIIESSKNDPSNAKKIYENAKENGLKITTNKGTVFSKKADINTYIADKIQQRISKPLDDNPPFKIGNFKISIVTSTDRMHPNVKINGERKAAYYFEADVGENADNYQCLMNFLEKGIEKQLENDIHSLEKIEKDLEQSKERVDTPFPNEEEYQDTLKQFEQLEEELTSGGYLDSGEEIAGAEDYGECETESLDNNSSYDEDDLTQEEYHSM